MSISFFNTESHNVVDLSNNSLPSAIPLIQENPHNKGKLMVNAQGIDFLKRIGHKIGSISVVGPYRSGKSYLLSRMLNTPDGFELGPTMNACTKGIWLSTKILVPKQANKPAIILLDTEGIGAVTATTEHDTAIATLSILLSSYFIYNSSGVPRADDLQKLQVYTNVVRKVVSGTPHNIAGLTEYFPDFLWVIRDAFLLTSVDGKVVTPKEYLVSLLHVDHTSLDEDPHKTVKKVLTTSFKSIDMDCIPPPHQDPEVVRHMEKQNDGNLARDFIPALKRVIEHAVSKTNFTKSIGKDSILDGTGFAGIVEKLVEVVNTPGNIPSFPSIWTGVVEAIFNQATDQCAAAYREKMQSEIAKFPLDILELNKIHKTHYNAVFDVFKGKVSNYVAEDMKERYARLQKAIAEYDENTHFPVSGVFLEFFVKNQEASKQFCNAVADEVFTLLKQKIHSKNYKFEEFVEDAKKSFEEYMKKAKGPAIEECRANLQKLIEGEGQFIKTLKGFSEKKAKEMEQREAQFQKKLEEEKAKNVQNELIMQMMEDNRKATEILQENLQASMIRMQEDSQRNLQQQAKQFEVLMETQGKQATEQLNMIVNQMNTSQGELIKHLNESAANNLKAIGQMAEAIKNIPPPQVTVKGGGCCIV